LCGKIIGSHIGPLDVISTGSTLGAFPTALLDFGLLARHIRPHIGLLFIQCWENSGWKNITLKSCSDHNAPQYDISEN
jgi:hypothetical protein